MKTKLNAVIAAVVLAAVAMPSFAKKDEREREHEKEYKTHSVPEINGAGAALALALLGSVVLIARERRRQQ